MTRTKGFERIIEVLDRTLKYDEHVGTTQSFREIFLLPQRTRRTNADVILHGTQCLREVETWLQCNVWLTAGRRAAYRSEVSLS